LAHRAAIGWDELKVIGVTVPPKEEQQAILSFLDDETLKIDALSGEQRRLIELLKEKRQAVISHAVTKGLNPEVSFGDSRVASFGFVPSHWSIRKIHALAKVGNGSTPSRERFDYWDGGEYPWLSSTVVNQEEVTQADQFVTELALKECHLPKISPPAVLVGITGQGKTRGMATTLRFEATINQHIAAVVPRNSEIDIEFLRRVFDMLYIDLRTDSEGGGSTKGAITCEQIQSLRIALPPIAEQIAIASWIRVRNEDFAALIGQSESAIGLLEERRSALISAAVTGKIDVRDYAPKETA
jgi:type I restriction enzyme, S subunit